MKPIRRPLYLVEQSAVKDAEDMAPSLPDTGEQGKKFEQYFVRACQMAGLKLRVNKASGKLWDIHPTGDGWNQLIDDQDVNIKVSRTKFMFSSRALAQFVWEKKPTPTDSQIKKFVKRLFKETGVENALFMRPKTTEIQQQIVGAVQANNVEAVQKLLVKKNFQTDKLTTSYKVVVNRRDDKSVVSVNIWRGSKVFMRTDPPRNVGGSFTVMFKKGGAKQQRGGKVHTVKNRRSPVQLLQPSYSTSN